jgi:hypothetical protein
MAIQAFISHSWGYSDHYKTLADWIFTKPWYDQFGQWIQFRDTSVPRNDPVHVASELALAQALDHRIRLSHVVVAPAGLYATHSRWIKFELDTANLFNIPVVQVNPWGQERKSGIVQNAADHEAGWNSQTVINAVWNAVGSRQF